MPLGYDVILWDWNGTLLDDAAYGMRIINDMLRRRGRPVRTRDEYTRMFDFPVIRFYERVGFDFSEEPFEVTSSEFIDTYYRNYQECRLQSGTHGLLEHLQGCGARQLVLSASRQDHLEQLVAHFGLRSYFEELLGIDTIHATGKVERGVEWILQSGLNPSRALLIGDTVHDAEVADMMGIDCWLVFGGHNPEDRLQQTGKPCFGDLHAVLKRIISREGMQVV